MRGIEALLLAAFIGLVGIGVWNARYWLPEWGPKVVNSAPLDTAKPSGQPAEKASTKAGRPRGKRPDEANRNSANDLALNQLAVSKTEVHLPRLEFPAEKDIRVGASGDQIRAQYGEPTARVTEMRGGRVLEQYYYFNRDRTRLTRATLQSGVIVSAESVAP